MPEVAIKCGPWPTLQLELEVALFAFSGVRQQSQIGRRRRLCPCECRHDLLAQLLQWVAVHR
jgi:hypothetical protein